MLDIKFIRENSDKIKRACENKQVKVDIGWVHGWWENDESNLPGDLPLESIEEISIDKFFATMSIRF